MKLQRYTSLFLIGLLIASSLAFGKCDSAKSARNIYAAGYDIYLALDAGAQSAQAFNTANRLDAAKYKAVLQRISKLKETARVLNTQFDQLPTIDPSSKLQILDTVQRFSSEVGELLASGLIKDVDANTQSQIRRWVFVASSLLDGVKIAVAAISAPTPAEKVLVGDGTVARVREQASKGFTDADAQLVRRLADIGSTFAAKLVAQKGATLETLRAAREQAYAQLSAFLDAELQRLV